MSTIKVKRPGNSYRAARRGAAREGGVLEFWSQRTQRDRAYVPPADVAKNLDADAKRRASGRWYSGKKPG